MEKESEYKFYKTKNGKTARFKPNNNEPWTAMYEDGRIVKKTIPIPQNKYSKEEPEYEKGYKKDELEIRSAKWIQGTLNKKVKLLKIKSVGQLNPDAMVEGKYVDFKNPKPTSRNGIDSLTRHGLEQINYNGKENAGFVFHWADDLQMNKSQINQKIVRRFERMNDENSGGFVLIKKKNKLFTYRKK